MRIASWQFNPGLWPSLACVALLLLLTRLGFWQLDRAEEKQVLHTQYLNRSSAEPVNLGQATGRRSRPEEMYWRRCILSGTYDPHKIYLLDNQVYRGKVGYQVFSRFVLEEGASLLVNRGWTAAPETRTDAPRITTTTGPVTLTGVAKPTPATGLVLAKSGAEILADNLVRVQHIDLEQIAADNNWSLLPYIVRLDPPATSGLSWNGSEPGFGKERHLGYAFQWFALAVALLVIYVVVNTIRRRGDREQETGNGESGK